MNIQNSLDNKLTIYHDHNHGFMKLECVDCSEGNSKIMYFGLYPQKDNLINTLYQKIQGHQGYNILYGIMNMFSDSPKYEIHDESEFYSQFYLRQIPQKSFNISSDEATQIYQRVNCLFNYCDKEYAFNYLTNTCVDFIQQIYELAGFQGNHYNELHHDTLPSTLVGWYGSYTYIRDPILDTLETARSYLDYIV